MNLPNYWTGKPSISATEENLRNRAIREGQITGGPGVIVNRTGNGTTVTLHPKPEPRVITLTPFWVGTPYDDSGTWKVRVRLGTLNGMTPVVGDVTGSGGSAMTASTVLSLSAGEPWVCLGVKTNLETRAITRLTLQTVEDLIPVVDTGARTRITYIPLAELTEGGDPEWAKASQTVETNLNYFTAGSSDITWRA